MKRIKNYKDFSFSLIENSGLDITDQMLRILDNNIISYSPYLQETIADVKTQNELEDLLFRESSLDQCETYIHIVDEIWEILKDYRSMNESVEVDDIILDEVCSLLDSYLIEYDYNKLEKLYPFSINDIEDFLRDETNYLTLSIGEADEILVKLKNILDDESNIN